MKLSNYLLGLFAGLAVTLTTQAQNKSGIDSTGLPGDNFSLQGALQLFQKASSPEDFERLLNSQDNHVNNLDLNGDGDIDYIRVIDNSDIESHAFVLQVMISEIESQDIAVIEIEKTGDTTAVLQIVGDIDIYGEEVIIEPNGGIEDGSFINDNNSSIARGPNVDYYSTNPPLIINVFFWPSVRFVYAPIYRPWVSPWRWRHYPGWWHPWRPLAWHVWHPFNRPFHNRFVVVGTHRVLHAHRIYAPLRVTSVSVRTRHATAVGNYRVNRARTTVTGPRGNKVTKTKATVTGPGGNKATKTRVRRH